MENVPNPSDDISKPSDEVSNPSDSEDNNDNNNLPNNDENTIEKPQEPETSSDLKSHTISYIPDPTSRILNDLMKYEKDNFSTVYVYGPTGRLSESTSYEGLDSGKATEKLYYHNDKLGSMIYLTDKNGEVKIHASYNIWGLPNVDPDSETDTDNITGKEKFTSYTYDDILELYFAQFRFYDPANMRFTQEDPIKDGVNWYGYVAGNPVNFVDPLGLRIVDPMRILPFDVYNAFNMDQRMDDYSSMLDYLSSKTKDSYILDNPMFKLGFSEGIAKSSANFLDNASNPTDKTLGAMKSIVKSGYSFGKQIFNMTKLAFLGYVNPSEIFQYMADMGYIAFHGALDRMIGDISYIYEHRHYFQPGFCVTGEEAREFGRRLFGALEELATLGISVYKFVHSAAQLIERKLAAKGAGTGRIPKPGDADFIGPLTEMDAARAANWTKPDGSTWWPSNNGAVPGTERTVTLQPGTVIGRIGGDNGSYVAPPGTSPEKLSLKPGTDTSVYTEYRVIKEITGVEQAEIASWFDMPGGGIQYKLPDVIRELVNKGFIEKIEN